MKLKLLLTLTALLLALCFTLTACGEKQTGGATADTATADSATVIADAAVPQSATDSALNEEEVSSAASSSAEAAPAPAANDADTPQVSHEEESPEQEEHSSSSAASSQAASSASSKAPSGNPAYKDDEKPVYTIAMTNQSTQKTYSASCSYTTDKEEVAAVAFFLPGGKYEIAVYHYTESKDKGEPLAKTTYNNSIAEDKRKSIQVNYTPKDNKIEVVESTSSRNQ